MELLGENNEEEVKKISRVWEFFVVKDEIEKLATCNICSEDYSYKILSNLSQHLTKMHNFRNMATENSYEDPEEVETAQLSNNETNAESDNDYQPRTMRKTYKILNARKTVSLAWDYFEVTNKTKRQARCRLCSQILSFNTSVSNLMKHVRRSHLSSIKSDDETDAETSKKLNDSKVSEDDTGVEIDVNKDALLVESRKRSKALTSMLWSYFKSIDTQSKIAVCLLCQKRFSYFGTISNLRKHLDRKHPNWETVQYSGAEQSEGDADGEQILTEIVVSDPDEIDALVMEDVYDYEELDEASQNQTTDPIQIENHNRERERLKRKRKVRMQNKMLNKKRFIVDNDDDTSDDEVTLQKRYVKKQNDSIDYFGKYVASLLKGLPRELSEHLQMSIVKQIIDVKTSYKSVIPNADVDNPNGYSITITTDNGAVVNGESVDNAVIANTE